MIQKPNHSPKSRRIGFLAGLLSGWQGKRLTPTEQDVNRLEFGTSSQKMGVTWTEKLRDILRFQWIRGRR